MIDNHSVLGVILARGGSKGLPRKNVRDLAGKPLIAWTIEAGQEAEYLDRLILSSDDDEIMAVAKEYGCEVPFRRPPELARDDTPSIDALLHAIDQVDRYDYVVLLQPTSPLRTADDIDAAIETCLEKDAPACVTVTEAEEPPHWMYTLDADSHLQPILEESVQRRQGAPDVYVLNGAVYVARTSWLRETRSFLHDETVASPMPREGSVDVDDELDARVAEMTLQSVRP
jgi:N-acylneuraminate cytidylyltransferase